MGSLTPFIFAGFSGAALICGIILFFDTHRLATFKILGSMLIVFAIECAFSSFMISRGYRAYPDLIGWARPVILLYGPLFLLTFSILTGYNSRIRPDHFFHFLPFIAHFFLMIPFMMKTPATKIFLYEHYVKGVAYIEYYPHFMMFMKVFFFSVYSIIPLALTYIYKKRVMGFYSTIDNGKIIKLYIVSWAYILSSIYLIYIFYGYLTGPSFLRPDIPYSFIYPMAGLIFSTAFFALTDPDFLKCSISVSTLIFDAETGEDAENTDKSTEKYQKNKIPDELAQKAFELLKEIMAEKTPFTDSNLTLVDLAEMIHIRPYHLSQLINSRTGDNFYVFINSARIKYAAELLKDPSHKEKSILEIIYMSGFNSKSAFNTYFKNIMGETPSNFRKKHSL